MASSICIKLNNVINCKYREKPVTTPKAEKIKMGRSSGMKATRAMNATERIQSRMAARVDRILEREYNNGTRQRPQPIVKQEDLPTGKVKVQPVVTETKAWRNVQKPADTFRTGRRFRAEPVQIEIDDDFDMEDVLKFDKKYDENKRS